MAFAGELHDFQQVARRAAAAGFSGLVVTEAGRTAYLSVAAAALSGAELDLATGVAVAFPAARWSPPLRRGNWLRRAGDGSVSGSAHRCAPMSSAVTTLRSTRPVHAFASTC
ncbi:MAG: hypothetical protein M5U19_17890 [Microthrixaceae bacterium]|nr:hypothetical protein [Microthrixaceae bacterium]